MRYANIKKASEDEQQNQTATNINYIKCLSVLKKNLNYKVNISSDKTETKQDNL